MAAGRVCIGFSYPNVANYNLAVKTVTYTEGMRLARGVKVSLDIETSDDNDFYADNVAAETDGGQFVSGTAKLTVDGLHQAAERFISGLAEPEEVAYGDSKVKVTKHGKNMNPPYLGIGFIVKYRSGGVDTYQPTILTKGKFKTAGLDAETQGKEIDYQTQELEADLCRDDTETEDWKWTAEEQKTEAAALAILDGLLSVAEAEG